MAASFSGAGGGRPVWLAVVVDLGINLGVEVEEGGGTWSSVLRVEVAS